MKRDTLKDSVTPKIPTPTSYEVYALWDLLPHPVGSVVRWFARKGEAVAGDYAITPEELTNAMEVYSNEGWSCYVQPNPTNQRVRTRSRSDDITHWSWLFLDIDPVDVQYNAMAALDECLLRLSDWAGKDLRLTNVLVVDSGRGAQAWIRLDDIELDEFTGRFHPDNESRLTVRKTMGYWLNKLANRVGLIHGCKLDTSCSDLPRVMRCPGTINQKTGRMARLVNSGNEHYGLAALLITGTPKEVFYEPPPSVEGRTWQQAKPSLTRTASDFLRDGHEEPGRHKTAVATVLSLRDSGVSSDEALKAVIWGNRKCRPPLGLNELQRMVNDAYKLKGQDNEGVLRFSS